MLKEINKILALAQRDFQKFIRDRARIISTFIFPFIFIGILAPSLNAGLAHAKIGFNFIDYVFTGMMIQTVFQSSLSGIVSLISDRERDFSMAIFVAPVSRYSIVLGKILGEGLVSFAQLVGIIVLGKILGVTFGFDKIALVLPFCLVAAFVGGGFGVLIASRVEKAENAQRVFPFLIFPLIFSSGAFTPVKNLPLYLNIIKDINPIYYGIDMIRNILFSGAAKQIAVSNSFWYDLGIFVGLGVLFFLVGTYLFTQKEGNK